MQIGSLVECVRNFEYELGIINPIISNYYTIRNIIQLSGGLALHLEEIQNPCKNYIDGTEKAFDIKGFKEIQPPVIINLKHIFENCLDEI